MADEDDIILSELDDDVVCAVVSQTQLSDTQFLQAVLTEFGFKPFDKEKVELLDMLNMYLTLHGYEFHHARNGQSALDIAALASLASCSRFSIYLVSI